MERVKPSSLNGKSREEEKAATLWNEWEISLYTPGMRVEDGENFDDLVARADHALDFLKNRKEEKFVVVTHGYFLRMIVARVVLGETFNPVVFKHFQSKISMENTGLSVLKYRNHSWRLWIFNDHAHLG